MILRNISYSVHLGIIKYFVHSYISFLYPISIEYYLSKKIVCILFCIRIEFFLVVNNELRLYKQ